MKFFSRTCIILFLSLLAASTNPLCGAQQQDIYSPFTAELFYGIASDITGRRDLSRSDYGAAMQFLLAAQELDHNADYVSSAILELYSDFPSPAYYSPAMASLYNYIDSGVNLEVAVRATSRLLTTLETREKREQLLLELFNRSGRKNALFASKIAHQLAVLAMERADTDTAADYLTYALETDMYNKPAFNDLLDILESAGLAMKDADYLVYMRAALAADRFNISTSIAFARACERAGMYAAAAGVWKYCADLHEYLFPDRPLPETIYIPWALNCYNTRLGRTECVQIAQKVARQGRFDLVLEALAGLSASQLSGQDQAQRMQKIASKAQSLYYKDPGRQITASEIAWFYSFAYLQPQKALAWANKAYSSDKESQFVNSLMAYALALDGQTELAREMAEPLKDENQIASLLESEILLKEGQTDRAIEQLKKTVYMDSLSLAGLRAKELLEQNGSEYLPQVPPEMLLNALSEKFADKLIPEFQKPSQIISARLSTGGTEFIYRSDLQCRLVLKNQSVPALVIAEYGMIKGQIRVDVEVTGDMEMKLPEVLVQKVLPSSPIGPEEQASIPLDIKSTELQTLLNDHPQANLDIKLSLYIDPVTENDGTVRHFFRDIGKIETTISRPAVSLTREFVIQRLQTLNKGTVGQQARVLELFAGLLAEQYSFAGKPAQYRYIYIEQDLLADTLRKGLADENWKTRLKASSLISELAAPVPFDVALDVSKNLSHEQWPLRLITVYILSGLSGEDFDKVLDWTVEFDESAIVRDMAFVLGGEPKKNEKTASVDEKSNNF